MSDFEQITKIETQAVNLAFARAILHEANNYFVRKDHHSYLPYHATQITHLLQATDDYLIKAESEIDEIVSEASKEAHNNDV